MSKELVTKVLSLQQKAESLRSNWTTYWQEIAKYVQPAKNDPYGWRAKGDKRGDELLDATAIHSNELLSSALHSMLTNPSVPWFGITTGNEELDNNDDARAWLSDAVRVMHNVLNSSNFQTEIHELYLDEGSFGTGAILIEEDDIDVVRFQARSIFELYILENDKGIVDTIFRKFKMNLHQIKQKFGEEWMDAEMQNECKNDPYTKEYEIIHAIMPRENGMDYASAKNSKEYKIAAYYVLKDKNILLSEGGYKEFPWAVPRWTKIAGEVYGRSPAMKALPDIKMLNKMMESIIKAAQLQIAPPLAVPDDGFILPVKMQPFGITYYRSGTQDEIKPLFQNIRLDLSREMVESTRYKIQQAFFIDQLQLRDGPQMTATEVMQRTDEQLRLLAPILGRQHNELLKPLITRVFNICSRKKLFKPVPSIIAKKNVEFIYSSQIAKVQRAAEIGNINKVISAIAPIIQSQPETIDYFDGDKILKYASSAYMLPANLIRKDVEVKQLRQTRQEANRVRAEEESSMKNAQMMKDMAPMINNME
jgi:hypothetical protein